MTCIVGFINSQEKKMTLVADSRVSTLNGRYRDNAEKIIELNEMLVGVSGSALIANAIMYRLNLPKHRVEEMSDEMYMNTLFLDALEPALKSAKCLIKNKDGETEFKGMLIVAYRNAIYLLGGNFHVVKSDSDFEVVGSGTPFAVGSLDTPTDSSKLERAKFAVGVSMKNLNNVGGEVVVVSK